jgi:hypothetical protein
MHGGGRDSTAMSVARPTRTKSVWRSVSSSPLQVGSPRVPSRRRVVCISPEIPAGEPSWASLFTPCKRFWMSLIARRRIHFAAGDSTAPLVKGVARAKAGKTSKQDNKRTHEQGTGRMKHGNKQPETEAGSSAKRRCEEKQSTREVYGVCIHGNI